MITTVGVSLLALAIAVLAHGAASIWWASRITSTVENISSSLSRIDKEFEKRDVAMTAMWKRIDEIKEKLTVVETRCGEFGKH